MVSIPVHHFKEWNERKQTNKMLKCGCYCNELLLVWSHWIAQNGQIKVVAYCSHQKQHTTLFESSLCSPLSLFSHSPKCQLFEISMITNLQWKQARNSVWNVKMSLAFAIYSFISNRTNKQFDKKVECVLHANNCGPAQKHTNNWICQ